jgi:hypothetical protein
VSGSLHPRIRDITSDAEWKLIEMGLCPVGGPLARCLKPIDPNSRYGECAEHDQRTRDEAGSGYWHD